MARKVKESDFDHIAEYVKSCFDTRKKNRKDLDRQIKEIDRQVAMIPKRDHKLLLNGQDDPNKKWLPEIELPLQAEALETLTADSRSMMFPDAGPWFAAHAALTDEYLERADFAAIIEGDENDVPSIITQDNADKLVAGLLNHYHRQYDFRGHIDVINAEAISYGVGIGRLRKVKKVVYRNTARGVVKDEQEIPILVPRSLKETFLDDREHILMHEGYAVGPMTIFYTIRNFDDVMKQAAKGSNDPNSESGGWRPQILKKIEPDDKGNIELLEAEGDFIIPRKTTGSIHLPNTVVTIATGKGSPKVVRLRFKKESFNSVIEFHYNKEFVGTPYGSSPLRKGLPLQAAAVEALMRVVEASALNTLPPVGYDRSDMFFAQQGGPVIEPGAMWPTISDINVHQIGNPRDMMLIYQGFLQQYADAVGMHRARLGAQTVSHTTAYAKNAEIQRGQVRTVDYVRTALQGPMTQLLDMEYKMMRGFKGSQTMWIDDYRGFVRIENKHLPDMAMFEAHGAGEPQEQQLARERRMMALREAMQMDQIGIQLGDAPAINLRSAIQETLTQGGWADIDNLVNQSDAGQGPAENPINTAILTEQLGIA